jgi:hypothetical protein
MDGTAIRARLEGVAIGRLQGFTAEGAPLVLVPVVRGERPIAARTTLRLGPTDLGRSLALLFEGGDPERPIVLGRLIEPGEPPARPVEAVLDGERVLLAAEREITLRCGKASITLTRAGKVLIRGAYLSSRSSGVNRIKGASVQLD